MTILATVQEMKPVIESWRSQNDREMLTIYSDWSEKSYTAEGLLHHFSMAVNKVMCGKKFRPWTFVDPSTLLDASQPWVGFEVESGYKDSDDFYRVVDLLEGSTYRVCVDSEGCGEVPAEITFMPVNLSDLRRSAGPEEIIRIASIVRPWDHDSEDEVGTHLNLSTPWLRGLGKKIAEGQDVSFAPYYEMAEGIEDAIMAMHYKKRQALFGRPHLYVEMPEMHASPARLEFKWFNTTYDSATWKGYCDVVEAIVQYVLDEERLFGTGSYNARGASERFAVAMDRVARKLRRLRDACSTTA